MGHPAAEAALADAPGLPPQRSLLDDENDEDYVVAEEDEDEDEDDEDEEDDDDDDEDDEDDEDDDEDEEDEDGGEDDEEVGEDDGDDKDEGEDDHVEDEDEDDIGENGVLGQRVNDERQHEKSLEGETAGLSSEQATKYAANKRAFGVRYGSDQLQPVCRGTASDVLRPAPSEARRPRQPMLHKAFGASGAPGAGVRATRPGKVDMVDLPGISRFEHGREHRPILEAARSERFVSGLAARADQANEQQHAVQYERASSASTGRSRDARPQSVARTRGAEPERPPPAKGRYQAVPPASDMTKGQSFPSRAGSAIHDPGPSSNMRFDRSDDRLTPIPLAVHAGKQQTAEDRAAEEALNIARRTRANYSLQDKSFEELAADDRLLDELLSQMDDEEEEDDADRDRRVYHNFLLSAPLARGAAQATCETNAGAAAPHDSNVRASNRAANGDELAGAAIGLADIDYDDDDDDDDDEYIPTDLRWRSGSRSQKRGHAAVQQPYENEPGRKRARRDCSTEQKRTEEERIAARTRAHVSYQDRQLEELGADEQTLDALMIDLLDDDDEDDEDNKSDQEVYHEFLRETLPPSLHHKALPASPELSFLAGDSEARDSFYARQEGAERSAGRRDDGSMSRTHPSDAGQAVCAEPFSPPLPGSTVESDVDQIMTPQQCASLIHVLQRFSRVLAGQAHAEQVTSEQRSGAVNSGTNVTDLLEQVASHIRQRQARGEHQSPLLARGVLEIPGFAGASVEQQAATLKSGIGGVQVDGMPDTLTTYDAARQRLLQDRAIGRNGRLQLCPTEDALLVLGLKRFSRTGWEDIQANLFPHLKANTLHDRFRNMCRKPATPDNVLRALRDRHKHGKFYDEFTLREDRRLAEGLAQFGQDFGAISRELLPHRGPQVIAERFKQVLGQLKQSTKRDQIRAAPAEPCRRWTKEEDRAILLHVGDLADQGPQKQWARVCDAVAAVQQQGGPPPGIADVFWRHKVLLVVRALTNGIDGAGETVWSGEG